jgi:hypothetical protein
MRDEGTGRREGQRNEVEGEGNDGAYCVGLSQLLKIVYGVSARSGREAGGGKEREREASASTSSTTLPVFVCARRLSSTLVRLSYTSYNDSRSARIGACLPFSPSSVSRCYGATSPGEGPNVCRTVQRVYRNLLIPCRTARSNSLTTSSSFGTSSPLPLPFFPLFNCASHEQQHRRPLPVHPRFRSESLGRSRRP